MSSAPTTRFAPSPTGPLHLGHIAHLLYLFANARKSRAKTLFRIEDHDQGRCRAEYVAAISEVLETFGFCDEPNFDCSTPIVQSTRFQTYEVSAKKLLANDRLYVCKCSRKEILARTGGKTGSEILYDGFCASAGHHYHDTAALRFRVEDKDFSFTDKTLGKQVQNPVLQCGDFLIRERSGSWTYQFGCVHDDWTDGVDLIVRGQDILPSTARQVQLGEALGRRSIPTYSHHPLILDASGTKLSKRDLATSVSEFLDQHKPPEFVLGRTAFLVGLRTNDNPVELKEILAEISDQIEKPHTNEIEC